MEAVKEFTVYRKSWQNASKPGLSALYTGQRYCCVGFYGLACGFSAHEMYAIAYLDSFPEFFNTQIAKDGYTNSIYGTNDDSSISDEKRELYLDEFFNNLGVKVKFLD